MALTPRPTLQKSYKSSVCYLYINRAIEFIGTGISNDRNFTLRVSLLKPHPPWVAPPPYNKLYTKDAVREFLKDNSYFKSHDSQLNSHPYMEKALMPNPTRFGSSGGSTCKY